MWNFLDQTRAAGFNKWHDANRGEEDYSTQKALKKPTREVRGVLPIETGHQRGKRRERETRGGVGLRNWGSWQGQMTRECTQKKLRARAGRAHNIQNVRRPTLERRWTRPCFRLSTLRASASAASDARRQRSAGSVWASPPPSRSATSRASSRCTRRGGLVASRPPVDLVRVIPAVAAEPAARSVTSRCCGCHSPLHGAPPVGLRDRRHSAPAVRAAGRPRQSICGPIPDPASCSRCLRSPPSRSRRRRDPHAHRRAGRRLRDDFTADAPPVGGHCGRGRADRPRSLTPPGRGAHRALLVGRAGLCRSLSEGGRGGGRRGRAGWRQGRGSGTGGCDAPAGACPTGSARVHAPADRRSAGLRVSARLVPAPSPNRRHIAPGPLTDFLIDVAAEVCARLLPASRHGPPARPWFPAPVRGRAPTLSWGRRASARCWEPRSLPARRPGRPCGSAAVTRSLLAPPPAPG